LYWLFETDMSWTLNTVFPHLEVIVFESLYCLVFSSANSANLKMLIVSYLAVLRCSLRVVTGHSIRLPIPAFAADILCYRYALFSCIFAFNPVNPGEKPYFSEMITVDQKTASSILVKRYCLGYVLNHHNRLRRCHKLNWGVCKVPLFVQRHFLEMRTNFAIYWCTETSVVLQVFFYTTGVNSFVQFDLLS